ncbi:DUF6148 family protein [Paenibacillus xanthanilyticus]|uniref:DUF6148 family protein n=1 Tax=Paenibacillus xanthanilyticus TaxID=1783531 RepID=A0ABV8KA97_9BACL
MPASAWTLEEAQAALGQWKQALMAVSTGQSYTIGGRSLTRASIKDIKDMIDYFANEITKLEAAAQGRSARRTRQFVPRDV